MENDIRPREGLLEPVLPGSTIFDESILPPLHNSYLYEESRKSFIYTSAHLINNDILQKKYAAFRIEKRESGYTDEELEESFGFLLFEDESKANKLGDSGLLTGHSSCSTLGDPSKGVYVSKYSDCLDVKRWYCGKSGHIAIVKLTKGRVKEVSDNYTVNFTAPTKGFDCHESDQLSAVTATTSSFLAFERTQHYLYELINGGKDTEKCPRHVCPFAIVTFSYGKAEPSVPESSEKSEEKTVFFYQPWIGQLVVESLVYEIGLKSSNGALLPAQLPKTLRIKTVIRVSDLRMLLPKEIFETCFSGEVIVGGRCCTLYEVVSTDADDSLLSILTEELKEKDIALVLRLGDDGFFVLLHSSYFLSYEDANSEKGEALQGMFIFSDSRTIQRDTKSCRRKSPLSSDILQVLPALNYAETEMEKSGLGQREKIRIQLEKHLEHYGTLIHPGLQSSPQREASMFPDQYDLPYVFKHIFPTPKWTELTQSQLKSYLDQPHCFEFPVKRATELLLAGREQRRDDPDDEVYYCISSPEKASRSPTNVWLEKPLEAEASCPIDSSEGIQSVAKKISDSGVTTESPPESKHSDHSDLSKECNAERLNKESSPALKTSPTTLEVDNGKTEVSMEIPQAEAVVVTPEDLTPSLPKESAIVNCCEDQTAQISSPAQEVMANETTLPIPKTSTPSEAKFSRTEPDVPLDPEIENKAPVQTDWRSLPRRRGRKRKRISKTSASKIKINQSLHSSSVSPSIATEATEGQCMGDKQNQPDIEMDQSSQQKLNIEDKPVVDLSELPSSNSAPSECLENHHSQSQEGVENQSFEGETPSKTAWKSLPRRCRKDQDSPISVPQKGNKEVSEESCKETRQIHPLKRKIECLRYGLKTIITDCGRIFVPHGQEVLNKDLELVKKRQRLDDGESGLRKTELEAERLISSQSSDKADSVGVCETVSAEVAPKVMDAKEDSLSLPKEIEPALKHSEESPEESVVQALDRHSSSCQSEQESLTIHEQYKTGNESSSETKTAVDEAKLTELEKKESGSSESSHKKKKRNTEYTIISISQLRTVLRRGKKDSDSTAEKAKESEKTVCQPNLNKAQGDDDKSNVDCKSNCDSVSQGQPDQANPTIPATEESECLEPDQKPQNLMSVEEKHSAKNHVESSMELSKDSNKDAQVMHLSSDEHVPLPKKASTSQKKRSNPPRKWYKRKAKEITEGSEHLTPSSHNTEQLKPAQPQTASDILTGHELEELFVGSDKKSCSVEGVVSAAPMPADALTLLADLALSGNGGKNEKTLQNLGLDTDGRLKQRQGMHDSVKESSSQEAISVLHALLRRPADDTLKLPIAARSPLPRGLVMRGEWVVVISKDHSYSQPPSLLLGLSGTHPQALPLPRTDYFIKPIPVDLYGRPLSNKDDWVLQRESRVNRNGWEQQPLLKKPFSSITKEKRRSKRRRQIVEKDGSVEVTRVWREQYDFSLDSKFTNDPHDKAVTRALHGPWNLSIVDSPEEVHLIFHMWIGLFYSRSPSRFFHFDPIGRVLQVGGNLPKETDLNSTAGFSKFNQMKVSTQLNTSLVSSALPAEPGVLHTSDETRKTSVPSSEVLDLSVKSCEPLDLTSVNIKTVETSTEKHDPLSLESPVSEMKSQVVSTSTDFPLKMSDVADSSDSVKRDDLHGTVDSVHGIHENATYIKSSNNCASGSSDGHVKQAANEGSDVQTSSDVQMRDTKELTHVDSSASVVQSNSSHEMNTKEEIISSQVHYSLSAKSLSPRQTPNSFVGEISTTVPIDYDSSASSCHEVAIKRHEPLKDNVNCSVEAAVSLPADTNSLAQKTVAVIVGNYSKIETILQNQNNSDTISVVQGQSDFGVEKDMEVDDKNNSKSETIATELDMKHFKGDTMTGQNRSDSKTETTVIMQGSQTLKESVILDVQCPGGSKDKMVNEQHALCADSMMAVHDLNDVNSDAIMAVADAGETEGEREVITYKPKDAEVESVVTRQQQADSEIEKIVPQEHDSEPASDSAISEQNQNRAESDTSERKKCSKGCEIQLDISVKNQNDTTPEAAVASQATKDSEVQSVITEQTHNETKLETTVTVQAHADSEIKAIMDMNQNDSKPKELAEGEHGNTEGETQAMEMELDDLNTEASISEENNRYSKDSSVMDLKENGVQTNQETVFSSDEYENKAPMDTQMDCNLECEKFTTGRECLADTSMEDVEKIDNQHMEHEMLPEVPIGKAGDDRSCHEGNVNKDVSIMEQNEQIDQSKGIVGETEDKSSAEIAEELPHDLAEQQKTSEVVLQEAVLTSSQVAHDPCCTTEGHELKETEKGIRCPTPTVDELPYIISTGSAPSRGSTPTQDELASDFGSAGGETKCPESCSDAYDKAVYDTEGLDLAALSHMIAWFRKEQNSKREIESMPSQNTGPVQLKLSPNSESRAPDNSSQLISSKELTGCATGCIESNYQNTEPSKEQCKDGPVIDQSEDLMPVLQNRCSADEHSNAVDLDTRDSKSPENHSLCSLSKSASHASIHTNAGKDRTEKQPNIFEEEDILDTESVSPALMKAKQQEMAYFKDIYSNKHKYSTGSYFPQRRNLGYTANLDQTWHWKEEEHHDALQYGVDSQFLNYDHMEESRHSSSTSSLESSSCNESFMNYRKGEGLRVTVDFKRDYTLSGHKSPIISALDDGDMQMTCKNYPRIAMHSRTIQNPCHKGTQKYVEKFLEKWDALHQENDDITQSSLDLEYLVFSEKMNHILKRNSKGLQTRNDTCRSPVTIQFSSLKEQDTSEELCDALTMFSESTIKVTLADRKERGEEDSRHMPLRLQRLSCKREGEAARSNISAITAEFAKSYYAMMDDVCTSKAAVRKTDRIKRQQDSPKLKMTKPVELSGKMKEDLFERLHCGLNSVVRQACKTKYRFFILVTSNDPFFRETKDLLENEGHIHVEPDQFELETDGPASPLLIILRNEDISSHICEVPHLLELKKSSSVLFAGIDQPDDFVNLTHQELFGKGGFVVFDGTALNKLTLENMKKIVVFLEKLSKKGKWKWFLHYRDSRRFRENARSQQDVQDRKRFLDCCQDAGIVDVLPYHECDVISRDQPNYLHCLVHLQVQNATTRYPVFVTDSPDKTFERNGILTMNMNTFLQILSNDSCTIS